MHWSDDQKAALSTIEAWKKRNQEQTLTVGGYAGTGKTSIVSHLMKKWEGTAVAALCGKAASVLRSKGVESAQTIHSLIYEVKNDEFRRKPYLPGVQSIIVDEASMVNTDIYSDLLDFGVPVLFVGDHGQLEPIGDNPRLMENPQVRLEKIHRQAANNPILRLATAFREGRDVPYWKDPAGRLEICRRSEFKKFIKTGVQVICGYNKSRHSTNALYRNNEGYEFSTPCPGERVICLRNNRHFGVFNGQQFTVKAVHSDEGDDLIEMTIVPDDGRPLRVSTLAKQYGQDVIDVRNSEYCLFDFGYCVTAHKAQGSEWDDVVALDQISQNWDAARWRYTVATRAKRKLTYCC